MLNEDSPFSEEMLSGYEPALPTNGENRLLFSPDALAEQLLKSPPGNSTFHIVIDSGGLIKSHEKINSINTDSIYQLQHQYQRKKQTATLSVHIIVDKDSLLERLDSEFSGESFQKILDELITRQNQFSEKFNHYSSITVLDRQKANDRASIAKYQFNEQLKLPKHSVNKFQPTDHMPIEPLAINNQILEINLFDKIQQAIQDKIILLDYVPTLMSAMLEQTPGQSLYLFFSKDGYVSSCEKLDMNFLEALQDISDHNDAMSLNTAIIDKLRFNLVMHSADNVCFVYQSASHKDSQPNHSALLFFTKLKNSLTTGKHRMMIDVDCWSVSLESAPQKLPLDKDSSLLVDNLKEIFWQELFSMKNKK